MAPTATSMNADGPVAVASSYQGHLTNGDPSKASKHYTPTHQGLFQVEFRDGEYNSCLVAKRRFAKGETIAFMSHAKPSEAIRYSTVQVGPSSHIELNSDLLYCNHSCNPSVHFDVSSSDPRQWRAVALRDIEVGDVLEFFYPSTEWNMAQPFDCTCSSRNPEKPCLKRIAGAKYIPNDQLSKYVVNQHILDLKRSQ